MSKLLIGISMMIAVWLSACAAQVAPTSPPLPTATQGVPTVKFVPPTSVPTATLGVPKVTVAPQTNSTPTIVQIGDEDKGKTFTASVGTHIQVVLHSTYWQFDDRPSPALKQLGPPVVTPDTSVRIPGTGAGTVAVAYQVVAPGQANIQATRVSCGEALLCAEDQRVFTVAIIIK